MYASLVSACQSAALALGLANGEKTSTSWPYITCSVCTTVFTQSRYAWLAGHWLGEISFSATHVGCMPVVVKSLMLQLAWMRSIMMFGVAICWSTLKLL